MFKLNFATDNDAFGPDEASARAEVARILREVAGRVEAGDIGYLFRTVYDSNGNDIGRTKLILPSDGDRND